MLKKPINLFTVLLIKQQRFLTNKFNQQSFQKIMHKSGKAVDGLNMVNDNDRANQDSPRGAED